jgi:hypothetical protein
VCAEASTVLRAVAADFFFNRWCLEIPSDNRIRNIPRRVHRHAYGFSIGNVSVDTKKHVRITGFLDPVHRPIF